MSERRWLFNENENFVGWDYFIRGFNFAILIPIPANERTNGYTVWILHEILISYSVIAENSRAVVITANRDFSLISTNLRRREFREIIAINSESARLRNAADRVSGKY